MKYSFSAFLLALLVSVTSIPAFADVSLSINIAPPELPIYEQPMLPGDGYIWTPGYWAYDYDDYYWVPGTWVRPPRVGFLWTPGYWFWSDNFYVFHSGYWGLHVGYYGGINYGYGYGGYGYDGGRWDRGRFHYNRSVNNINVTNVHNTYTQTVVNNVTVNRASYNGGNGGTSARPSAEERTRERDKHVAATTEQAKHEQAARARTDLRQSANHGRPPIAATPKPGVFEGRDERPAGAADGNQAAGKARANARQAKEPAAAAGSEPGKNTERAEPRGNVMKREKQQQPKADMQTEQPQARPQKDQKRQQPTQQPEQPRQQELQQRQPRDDAQPEPQDRPQQEQQRQQRQEDQPRQKRQERKQRPSAEPQH